MGYTHYWNFKAIKRGTTKQVNAKFKLAVAQCAVVVKYYQSMANVGSRLSGYTAHTDVGQYGGLHVNGKAELSHEDFVIREHYKENVGTDFCKTNQKPYDVVVVACLTVLKHYLGDQIEVSSDGDSSDWAPGVGLARAALGFDLIKNPIRAKEQTSVA